MALLDPQFATRRRLNVGLVLAGALTGFVFGLVLTRLAKIIAEAPPAPASEYLWNAAWVAGFTAIVSPLLSWSFLRRVPLWRTVVEPFLWASAGGAAAIVLGIPPLILLLPPIGIVIGVLNLRRQYPDPVQRLGGSTEPSGLTPSQMPVIADSDPGHGE